MLTQKKKGFILPFAVLLIAGLTVAVGAVFTQLVGAAKVSTDLIARRKAFYLADGMSRRVANYAQTYMGGDGTPSANELKRFFFSNSYTYTSSGGPYNVDNLVPTSSGYSLEYMDINVVGNRASGVAIPSGPFKGILATQ